MADRIPSSWTEPWSRLMRLGRSSWTRLGVRPHLAVRIVLPCVALVLTVALWGTLHLLHDRVLARDVVRREAAVLAGIATTLTTEARTASARIDDTCGPVAVRALARASIVSSAARRFFAVPHHGGTICGPLGPGAVLPPAVLARVADTTGVRFVDDPSTRRVYLAWQSRKHDIVAEVDGTLLAPLLRPPTGLAFAWQRTIIAPDGVTIPLLRRGQFPDPVTVPATHLRHALMGGYDLEATLPLNAVLMRIEDDWLWHTGSVLLLLLSARVLIDWWLQRRIDPVRRLQYAIRKRRFEPWVQPIVDTVTGQCVGGEILMRWSHPARGLLAPGEFIALAEVSGLIDAMTEQIMVKARDRLASARALNPNLFFSFNVTPQQLLRPDLLARLTRVFDDESLPRHAVVLEITERDVVSTDAFGVLGQLREAGFRIAIDDFGTGQSSLALLDQLPIDRLKIDRAFIDSVREPADERPVLDAIIAMAHKLRLPMVAEGVETDGQRRYLRARGVQSVQGYLVARPMPISEFVRWLEPRRDVVEVQTPTSFDAIVHALLGPGGVAVRDRWWRFTRYPNCFVAQEAVSWLASHLGVSRERAVRLGERLTALGYIEHVVEEHDFKDEHLFFRVRSAVLEEGSVQQFPSVGMADQALREDQAVLFRSVRHGAMVFSQACRGDVLTSWLATRFELTPDTALRYGRWLLQRGVLVHVFDDQPFASSGELYRLG